LFLGCFGLLLKGLHAYFNVVCVIRRKAATDSDAIRPPIPTEVGHPFRSKPATQLRPV
jgi:hypothetical protein